MVFLGVKAFLGTPGFCNSTKAIKPSAPGGCGCELWGLEPSGTVAQWCIKAYVSHFGDLVTVGEALVLTFLGAAYHAYGYVQLRNAQKQAQRLEAERDENLVKHRPVF